MRKPLPIPAAALVLFIACGISANAQPNDVNVSAGLTAKGAPLALRGYDPVAYFTAGKPQLGSTEFAAVHHGATYQFSSKENLALFEKDPDRYVPQYGGYCAYGVAEGAKFDGDPLVWKIVDGRLYLNFNASVQKTWESDLRGHLSKANDNWTRIRDTAPAALKPRG